MKLSLISTHMSYETLEQKMTSTIFLSWASQEKQRTGRPPLEDLQLPGG